MTTNDEAGNIQVPTASETLKASDREMGAMDTDIAKLASFLSLVESDNNEDDPNVPQLLGRLEHASDMAQGVEDKLDDLLERLDTLLASLETQGEVEKTSKDETNEPTE